MSSGTYVNIQWMIAYLLLISNYDFTDNKNHAILLRVRLSDLNQYTRNNIAKYFFSIWQAWISSLSMPLPFVSVPL